MALKKLGRGLDVLISSSTPPFGPGDESPAPATQPAPRPGASDSLIPPDAPAQPDASPAAGAVASVIEIDLDKIDPNPNQPRKSFDENDLGDLIASIAKDGVLQPVLVRRTGERYQLIAGERRLRAARRVPLRTIPAIVLDADGLRAHEISLIENVQRTDLNPIELAEGFRALLEQHGLTQEELAARIGKRRSTIANTIRLLELPDQIQAALARGEISSGHAKIILSVGGAEDQLRLFRRIRDQELTVRETEAEPGARKKNRKPKSKPTRSAGHAAVEERLTRALGTKVIIQEKNGRGAIAIEFYSREELERLVDILSVAP